MLENIGLLQMMAQTPAYPMSIPKKETRSANKNRRIHMSRLLFLRNELPAFRSPPQLMRRFPQTGSIIHQSTTQKKHLPEERSTKGQRSPGERRDKKERDYALTSNTKSFGRDSKKTSY